MTNITGKIYQMQNAAGTENRFPRTVMEAVLGLNSYLQDQFSALADIYMPIEGISEAFTWQEFVYRATPNTIKAKSLTIDRIKGKTLAWNQLESCENWFGVAGNTIVPINGGYRVTSPNRYIQVISSYDKNFISGHKYLASFTVVNNSSAPGPGQNQLIIYYNAVAQRIYCANNVGHNSLIFTSESTITAGIQYQLYFSAENITVDILYPQIIDLTLLYGTEIDGMTDAEILAKFEADFGTGYYPYTTGTLISNDAEAVETTGVNQWDEEWESGVYAINSGVKAYNSQYIRCKNLISVFPNTTYYKRAGEGAADFSLCFYDANKQFIRGLQPSANADFTTPDNCYYLSFYINTGTPATYNHDICINLSDPAINGQYFPYKKNTLPLNLNDFWVKDSNGNQVHITGGLKSAGSVRDEIVGNKYIMYVSTRAYQSGDESNTSVTTDGHEYTNYPLATPIEYNLVEPLIYTMKAGTTEARISPNSDGLSAPFCCDMTYSASENNDSESAQYAATAGRLLNSHKIWGQDFNGSEDVDGNLVANGTIQGTQLKSTVATGTEPLTVASATMVQNLVAEKASKLLTARTIWGQSFDGSDNISGAISNITTISASGLATISGGIALGTSTKAQAAKMVWDETNEAWHLQGNLYADGSISAKGPINDSSNYATIAQLNELIARVETLEEQ